MAVDEAVGGVQPDQVLDRRVDAVTVLTTRSPTPGTLRTRGSAERR